MAEKVDESIIPRKYQLEEALKNRVWTANSIRRNISGYYGRDREKMQALLRKQLRKIKEIKTELKTLT